MAAISSNSSVRSRHRGVRSLAGRSWPLWIGPARLRSRRRNTGTRERRDPTSSDASTWANDAKGMTHAVARASAQESGARRAVERTTPAAAGPVIPLWAVVARRMFPASPASAMLASAAQPPARPATAEWMAGSAATVRTTPIARLSSAPPPPVCFARVIVRTSVDEPALLPAFEHLCNEKGQTMDQMRFDDLTRSLSGAPSRRDIVRGFVGAAFGLAAARLPQAATARKKRRKKQKPCAPCQQRTNGRCNGAQPNGTPCGECGTCVNGVCSPAKVDCGGVCTFCDTTARCRTSPNGAPCLGDGTCLDGGCQEPL
jgi:hypothetical protein